MNAIIRTDLVGDSDRLALADLLDTYREINSVSLSYGDYDVIRRAAEIIRSEASPVAAPRLSLDELLDRMM
jgi:hypothetical protein